MSKPKSILKLRPEINNNTSKPTIVSPTRPASGTNWLSRLQSKLYSQQFINHNNSEDTNEPDLENPLLFIKQDLKRVTFPIGNLATEFPFYSDDSPRDETFEKFKKQREQQPLVEPAVVVSELTSQYEHACIQREQVCIDRFRNILKESRASSELKAIDLSKQAITRLQAGPFSDILLLKFGLNYLNLSGCKLEDETIRIILCSLLVSNTITHLNISQNNFRSKGYRYIALFIKESKTLETLDLSKCVIERKGMQYLSQGFQYSKSLYKLILDDCQIRPVPEACEIFSEGVYHSISIKSLSLRNNQLAPPHGTWISNLVAFNQDVPLHGLSELDLSGNNLGFMIAPLASVLRDNTTLLHLNLSNSQISFEGLSVLSNALSENKTLESLDLSRNPLNQGTDEGILALKSALARNTCLQSLNLSDTQLDSSSAITLAEALPENKSLTRLDLSKNPQIEMAGVLALSISIKMNHTLTFLDINIPPSDEDLANLQNDIVAVCTTNMLRKVEAQKHIEEPQSLSVTEEEDNISPSPSSSSSSSNISTLDNHTELPSTDMIKEQASSSSENNSVSSLIEATANLDTTSLPSCL
ncbi:uncharacterized protein B0P05DRAFT_522536 [Gilbertella persicaria]|uniref:Uncharacterized protein n=1 Tax=Rhizopus stolonifer TaxID=4846 RepID=A0A367KFV7_RHIST|nr:uncharacterized protein B0P05DRAFT_522536 [Gilbertella persicaria]KAI8097900.1 hypothetical protein B0P05DRAFT_522536 [Gilbertella persicaria]RCI01114.1 hypothetical protein CU098_009125 [Rhizopus stolonifer]